MALYNVKLKREKKPTDCLACASWNARTKTCRGKNRVCFEYDPKTKTVYDGKTKLPIKV